MSTKKVNYIIDQGADFSLEFSVSDENGDPKDLTDYDVLSRIRKSYTTSANVTFRSNTQSSEGVVFLYLTANDTLNIESGRYVHDVYLIDRVQNLTYRIIEGLVTVTPSVTYSVNTTPSNTSSNTTWI